MALYQLELSGGGRTIVTQSKGWNTAPSFGLHAELFFMSTRDGNPVLALEGETLRRLTTDPATIRSLA